MNEKFFVSDTNLIHNPSDNTLLSFRRLIVFITYGKEIILDQEAPEGYVAGLARGAVGFRTSTSPDSFNRGIAIVQNEEEEDEDNNNETTTQLNEDGILSTKTR